MRLTKESAKEFKLGEEVIIILPNGEQEEGFVYENDGTKFIVRDRIGGRFFGLGTNVLEERWFEILKK